MLRENPVVQHIGFRATAELFCGPLNIFRLRKDDCSMATTATRTAPKARPINEVRLGRIKAAIWKADTQVGIRYNVTFARIFKDGDQWKSSDSFGRDDLPLLAKVADMAHTWIFEQGQSSDEDAS